MKRILLFLAALLLLTTAARAAALPEGLAEALPDGLTEAAEHGTLLTEGAEWLRRSVGDTLGGSLRGGVRSAALLTLTALICGAAQGLAGGAGEAAARCVPFCGVLAASALAAGDLRSLLGLGMRTVQELGALSRLLLPALAASMAAGAALDDERVDRLAGWIVKLVSGALALTMAAFTAYLATAGVLTGSADRAAVRVTKAAVAGAVPVVGGVLADAAEGVLAAAGTLRGTIGALGVFAILAACLAPLLRLGAQFLLYRLAAFAAELAGTKELGRYLGRLGEAFALVFALTASCALLLLVALLVAASMASG